MPMARGVLRPRGVFPWGGEVVKALEEQEDSLSCGENVLENKLCLSRANRLLDLRVCWEHGLCCKNPMKS